MFSAKLLSLAALASLVSAHSQILNAQGIAGSPASLGFQVDDLARNCTSISPCQQDATIIRDAEIKNNVANECGRTQISGNIDVGENTENALAAGQVTQVKAGTQLTVTIHQVNADGAGPYVCDMDPTGNTLGATGQTPLTVTDNVPGANGFSQAKTQDFNVTITMPGDFTCTGGSTGDICTVRCRNNALAGPFGGCFAVQQVDGTNSKTNVASEISTASTKEEVDAQVEQDKADLKVAIAANQVDGTAEQLAAAADVNALIKPSIVSVAAVVQTPAPSATGSATSSNNNNNNDNNNNNNSNNNNNNNNANASSGGRQNNKGNNNNN